MLFKGTIGWMSRSLRAGTEGAQWSVDPPAERLDECGRSAGCD